LIEVLTFLLVMTVVVAIVWKGGEICYDAFVQNKRSMTILELPLFPSMVLVPIGALLLGMQSFGQALEAVLEVAGHDRSREKEE
jgi:TRAP-type mannitol/chloroaromatic compound transport system permease small subunit